MSEVIVYFRVLPADSESDLSSIETKIREKVRLNAVEKEPLAFGLFALKVTAVVEDEEGGTDRVEEYIRSIEGVGEVEITGISRAL